MSFQYSWALIEQNALWKIWLWIKYFCWWFVCIWSQLQCSSTPSQGFCDYTAEHETILNVTIQSCRVARSLEKIFRYRGVAHFFKQTLLNNNGHFLLHICLKWSKSTHYSVQLHCLILILKWSQCNQQFNNEQFHNFARTPENTQGQQNIFQGSRK